MQKLTKFFSKSESRLSFSYENTVTEGTNLKPIKAMRRDERFFHWRLCKLCLKNMCIVLLTDQNAHA